MNEVRSLRLKVGDYDLIAMIQGSGEEAKIALKPLCDVLGIDWSAQAKRLSRNPQFSCGHMTMTGSDGKNYTMICLPIGEVGMFLCTINARKVRNDIREQLISFQKRLQSVIQKAIFHELTGQQMSELVHTVKLVQFTMQQLQKENQELRYELEQIKRGAYHGASSMLRVAQRAPLRAVH